jgi:ankyrin repeat protein
VRTAGRQRGFLSGAAATLLATALVALPAAFAQNEKNGATEKTVAVAQLLRAAAGTDTAKLEKLLALGADANLRNRRGETALQLAAASGRTDNVRLLIERGAKLEAPGGRGSTALAWAARGGHLETMRALLDAGAAVDGATAPIRTPLALAVSGEQTASVRLLIERGSKALVTADLARAVLQAVRDAMAFDVLPVVLPPMAAQAARNEPFADVLADQIAATPSGLSTAILAQLGPLAKDQHWNDRLLFHAASRGRPDLVTLAAAAGGRPEGLRATHGTALGAAVARNDAATVAALLGIGADPLTAGVDHAALRALAGDILAEREKLESLAGDVPVDARDRDGMTPLFRAAARADETQLAALLARGADPDATVVRWDGDSGWTPLMIASAQGHRAIVERLLGAGADVNRRNGEGRTALAWAAFYQRSAVVRVLLAAGGDPLAADRTKLSPQLLAQLSGDRETIELVVAAVRDRSRKP